MPDSSQRSNSGPKSGSGSERPGFPARVGGAARKPGAGTPPAAPPLQNPKPPQNQQNPQKPLPLKPLPAANPGPLTMPMPLGDAASARAAMVRNLAAEGIADKRVLRAMGAVERHHFVETGLGLQSYQDTALPIGLGQTISKPSVVARMLELLVQGGVQDAQGKLGRVLEIGTGCGYQAVVLSHLASEVYSIERLRELHEKARTNLRPMRIPNVHLILGDGLVGFAKGAPYAAIIVAAGGEDLPHEWIDQLAEGGRIVAPIAVRGGAQALLVVDKNRDAIVQTVLEPVNFVPLKSGIS